METLSNIRVRVASKSSQLYQHKKLYDLDQLEPSILLPTSFSCWICFLCGLISESNNIKSLLCALHIRKI